MNEWNGDLTTLPAEGEKFLYKGNVFHWAPCDCGNPFCNRPLAYNEKDEPVEHMTIRIRGTDQGKARVEVLMKMRGWSYTEVADKVETGIPVIALFVEAVDEVERQMTGPNDWGTYLDEHKIDTITMMEAMGML